MDDAMVTAALGHQANFVTIALLILANCLKNQGALGARQYEGALRATIRAGGTLPLRQVVSPNPNAGQWTETKRQSLARSELLKLAFGHADQARE